LLPIASALAIINEFGFSGLRKMAVKCHKKAVWVGRQLESNGFELLTPIESGVVPIKCSTEKAERTKSL
jgi:glutamate/tyrosine decarboxylase-like PLP-dependent enzyme